MKRVLFGILLLSHSIIFCQNDELKVDINSAEIVSKNFFIHAFNQGINNKNGVEYVNTDELQIAKSFLKEYKGHPSIYIVNFESGGWVITSAHKGVGPILAYSEKGSIEVYEQMSDVFIEWMSQYEFVIDSVFYLNEKHELKQKKWNNYLKNIFYEEKNNLKSTFEENRFFLLDTEWGQSIANINAFNTPAYNYLLGGDCDNATGNFLAGCTAVSIGQIMKYWEFSNGNSANFDWWNMPDILNEFSQNYEVERRSISYLLKRINEELNTQLGCEASSAYPLFHAKNTFKAFGYKETQMSHNFRSLHTYNQWVNLLKNELNQMRPIQYNSINHSFVCDGYVYGTNHFHFNLGWLRNNNVTFWGNFDELPTSGSTLFHECLTGIEPDWRTFYNLQNITINNQKTFQAKMIFAAGVSTYFNVENNSDCRMLAHDCIVLLPGFWAKHGSESLIKIFQNTEGTLKTQNFSMHTLKSDEESRVDEEFFNIFISPNPSKNGEFFLSINEEIQNFIEIKVYSINGVLLNYEQKYQNNFFIDLKKYSKGIYLLNVNYNNKFFNYKLIYE